MKHGKDKSKVPKVIIMNEEIKENLNSPYNEDFFKLFEDYLVGVIKK
jgi:hypothetical protein